MTRGRVRAGLFVALLAVLAAGATLILLGDRELTRAGASGRAFELAAERASLALLEARAAQHAYVAAGQSQTWWHERASVALDAARRELRTARELAASDVARGEIEAASTAVDGLVQLDGRAFTLAAGGASHAAAAVIFQESLDAATAVSRRLGVPRLAERASLDRLAARLRAREMALGGLAAAVALLVAGLLLGARAPTAGTAASSLGLAEEEPAPLAPDSAQSDRAESVAARIDLPLATFPPEASVAADLPLPRSAVTADADEASRAHPTRDRRRALELQEAADLCTDLARVLETQELPGLLERAARLLDARGLIIWIATPDDLGLRPAMAHGYTASALARLPVLARHADNATVAAWRDVAVHTVRSSEGTPGAIVVPLLGSSGCLGVMAAEVAAGREESPSVRALARIVAAQLATLVAAGPSHGSGLGEGLEAVGS